MARFTLTVRPDGFAILSTPDDLTPEQAAVVRAMFMKWRKANETVLVANCDVVRVLDVDLDIPEPVAS